MRGLSVFLKLSELQDNEGIMHYLGYKNMWRHLCPISAVNDRGYKGEVTDFPRSHALRGNAPQLLSLRRKAS